jgi:MFS family permease
MMLSVAIGWEAYARTHQARSLGLLGLFQFVPIVLLLLVGGDVADRRDRRRIAYVTFGLLTLLSLLLCAQSRYAGDAIWPLYTIVALFASVRAFVKPAFAAHLRDLVPTPLFARAVAWVNSNFEASSIAGPALGGWIYACGGGSGTVYLTAASCYAVATLLLFLMATPAVAPVTTRRSIGTLLAGAAYVWRTKAILGSISLDLFAVFFGGAVALAPVYARDILLVGPTGAGLLRAAPALGATLTGIILAVYPPRRHAGAFMLIAVAVFGAATVVFGLSRDFALSLAALVVVGASDQVSVFVRNTLVQLATPRDMRGRVMAINEVFLGTSNELGDLESGMTASWFGAVRAVVFGGIAAVGVAAAHAARFRELRDPDMLDVKPETTAGQVAA